MKNSVFPVSALGGTGFAPRPERFDHASNQTKTFGAG